MKETLISAPDLASHLPDPDWIIMDCRFSLDDTDRGRRAYLNSHIPGAQYAHLDEDLCGPVIPGETGRHPLPTVEEAARKFSSWGIGSHIQVVAYDDAGGAYAARLWWMLRWLGHQGATLLDGGWNAWVREGFPVQSGEKHRPREVFVPAPQESVSVSVETIEKNLKDRYWTLVDSRAAERYRGEIEPIDPVAGHIPGALNAPHTATVDQNGIFLPSEALRSQFKKLLGTVPPEQTVFYCGSGVTAARNLLAMELAGMPGARLYPGSWSEWITDPERPVESGESSATSSGETNIRE